MNPIAEEIALERMSMAASAQMVAAGTIIVFLCVLALVTTGNWFRERRDRRMAQEAYYRAFWAKVDADFELVERLAQVREEMEVAA